MSIEVLPEALLVYQSELINILSPLMLKDFNKMFQASIHHCESRREHQNTILHFQKKLKNTRLWSAIYVDQKAEYVKEKIPCIDTLIAAVFIGKVKILANIRLRNSKNLDLKIKVPALSKFIHTCYVNSAYNIYQEPLIFLENKLENREKTQNIIQNGIHKTISQMLPINDVLETYIGNIFDEEVRSVISSISEKLSQYTKKSKHKDNSTIISGNLSHDDFLDNSEIPHNNFNTQNNPYQFHTPNNQQIPFKENYTNIDKEIPNFRHIDSDGGDSLNEVQNKLNDESEIETSNELFTGHVKKNSNDESTNDLDDDKSDDGNDDKSVTEEDLETVKDKNVDDIYPSDSVSNFGFDVSKFPKKRSK